MEYTVMIVIVQKSSKSSTLLLASALALYVPSILTCGVYAKIGDTYGRKYAIIIPLVGMTFYTAGYLYIDTFSPPWYFMGSVVTNLVLGACGGYVTFIMACLCYVSDCTATSPHTRKVVYSATEATIFFPQVFAPVLSGIWAKYYGFGLPLLIGVVLSAAVSCYLLTIPESLPERADSRTKRFEVDPLETFKNMRFLFSYQCEEGDSPLPWIGGAFLIFFTAVIGQTTIKIVYMKHMLDWDSGVIGVYDGLEGLIMSVSMLFAPDFFANVFSMKLSVISWIQIGYAIRFDFR
jgi:MFS family permease